MLGDEIRAIRELRGLTREQVVAHVRMSSDSLKKIETGERYPTLHTLEALAECLRMNVCIGPTDTTVEALD